MLIIPKTFCLKCTEFYVERIPRALVKLNRISWNMHVKQRKLLFNKLLMTEVRIQNLWSKITEVNFAVTNTRLY